MRTLQKQLQWMLEHGYDVGDPVLQRLDNIRQADALIQTPDNAAPFRTPWPAATCIVSNPPFLGGNKVRAELGDQYVETLWREYGTSVGAFADLVCYFVERAREQMAAGQVQRVGLITTSSIRGHTNRQVIENIKQTATSNNRHADLFMAWSKRPWQLEGAAVEISLIAFDIGEETSRILDGLIVNTINSDLTGSVDLTRARRLVENLGISFKGTNKDAPFEIDDHIAQSMLAVKGNPNGRPNNDVVKRWMNGFDVTRRPRNMWIIDFGTDMTMEEAALYEMPFEYIKKHVLPQRERSIATFSRSEKDRPWWRLARPRPELRKAIKGLGRVCKATTRGRYTRSSPSPDNYTPAFHSGWQCGGTA